MANTLVSHRQGGATLDVYSGGKINIYTGGCIIPNGTTSLPTVENVTGGSTVDAESRTAINAVLTALRNVGILGSS